MNQIPNIEETRESVKKVLKEYYGYKSEQDVPYGLASVLEDWLHHQLQKAREELAGEVRLLVAKYYKTDEFDEVGFLNELQAELDQDKK